MRGSRIFPGRGGGARTFCGNVDSHAYENTVQMLKHRTIIMNCKFNIKYFSRLIIKLMICMNYANLITFYVFFAVTLSFKVQSILHYSQNIEELKPIHSFDILNEHNLQIQNLCVCVYCTSQLRISFKQSYCIIILTFKHTEMVQI